MKIQEEDFGEYSNEFPHKEDENTVFGFWIYLLSDLMFFAILFATYVVLSKEGVFGGLTPKEIVSIPFATSQSLLMLLAAVFAGIGGVCAHRGWKQGAASSFGITVCIGLLFLKRVGGEWSSIIAQGYDWTSTAFLSIYFTLMGTFALHMILGIVWGLFLIVLLLKEEGVSFVSLRRLTCLRMFWQFMNLIWVFIFTFAYMLGAI